MPANETPDARGLIERLHGLRRNPNAWGTVALKNLAEEAAAALEAREADSGALRAAIVTGNYTEVRVPCPDPDELMTGGYLGNPFDKPTPPPAATVPEGEELAALKQSLKATAEAAARSATEANRLREALSAATARAEEAEKDALETLDGIANANAADWKKHGCFDSTVEPFVAAFRDWAQSRARHTAAAIRARQARG